MERLLHPLVNRSVGLLFVATMAIVVGLSGANLVAAQEFRIESQVYIDSSTLPVSQNVTLFSNRIVYDFQMSDEAQPKPIETVIYDATRRLMVLIDAKRQIRLELPELRLMKILESVRQETLKETRSSFLVKDRFKEDNDWATKWVTLASPTITYRYTGSHPKNAEILPPYFEFLDNFTRLIATDPTKIPPFARLELNNSIRRVGWMPSEVQISVKPNALFKQGLEAKSTHTVVSRLSDKDHQRIAEAKRQWLGFRAVDLAEYRNLKQEPMMDLDNLDGLASELESKLESKVEPRTASRIASEKGKVIATSHTESGWDILTPKK